MHSTRVAAPNQLALSLSLSLLDDPLVIVDADGNRVAEAVHQRTAAEVMAAYGFGRAEVFAALPVVLSQGADANAITGQEELSGAGLGDARLGVRASLKRFLGNRLGAGAGLQVSMPTSIGADFAGADGLGAHPYVVTDLHAGPVRIATNLGARLRGKEDVGNLSLGSAFTYGLGASAKIADAPFWLIGELDGEVAGFSSSKAPLEGRAALRGEIADGYFGQIGYGRGIVNGYGAPDHRVFASLTFRPALPKADKHVVAPVEPVVVEPPENPDPDGDGIAMNDDKCPLVAEDFDGFEDLDGCPEGDNDSDGIADEADKCRNTAEDIDGFEDLDGCPDPDNDNDGLMDTEDKCPDEAEVINGVDDDDGCPDEGVSLVVVGSDRLVIKDSVYFAYNKAEILARSTQLLDQIAKTLERTAAIKKVRIGGHTDSRGNDDYNRELSDRRANAVMEALVARGIDAGRLEAIGYGEDSPIDSNKTSKGRASNRRVEFVIVDQQGTATSQEGETP